MAETLSLNIKGPSDTKLAVSVPADASVADLKAAVEAADASFPKDQQRLIFSGRVLKDEDPISKYGIKNGVAIHLVCPPSLFPLFPPRLSSAYDPLSSLSPPRSRALVLLVLLPPARRKPRAFRRRLRRVSKSQATRWPLCSMRRTLEHSEGASAYP